MELDITRLLHDIDILLIFTVLAFGLLLGKVQLKAFTLGSTAGVLLVGLLFGYLEYDVTNQTESIGFMLFIFCVGIEAGPNFFSVMAQDGLRYMLLSLVVILLGLLACLLVQYLFGFKGSLAAGLFAGALTSTPSLVGAQDAILTRIPDLDAAGRELLINQLSSAYALSYVIGLVAIILLVRYLPKVLKMDLEQQANQLEQQRGFFRGRRAVRTPILRAYEVDEALEQQLRNRTLREIGLYEKTGLLLERIKRDGEVIVPDSETILQRGDRFAMVGYPTSHAKVDLSLLTEVFDPDLIEFEIATADVVVVRRYAAGKTLQELALESNWGCFAHALERGQVEVPLNRKVPLTKGDIVSISGEKLRLQELVEKIGFENKRSDVTDLLAFSIFFILGLVIGQFTLVLGDFSLSLGNAGGLLMSGVLMGYLRANRPSFGHVPQGALNMLKDLGLNVFMVSVGLSAGAGITEVFASSGWEIMLASLLIVLSALLSGYAFGRLVLGMNPALLLGAITGAMTSTPAMGILNESSRSSVPALGYVGTYAMANILLTLVGAMLVLL